MPDHHRHLRSRSLLVPIAALALCTFLWPALFSFDAGDWPSPNRYPHNTPAANVCGPIGAWFAYHLLNYLGNGAYALLLFGTLAALIRIARGEIGNIWERVLGLFVVVACTSISAHLISPGSAAALPVGSGGLTGYALGELMRANLSRVGTVIVLVSSLIVGLIFTTEGWVLTLPSFLKRMGRTSGRLLAGVRAGTMAPRAVPAAQGVTVDESRALLTAKAEEANVDRDRSGLGRARQAGPRDTAGDEEEDVYSDEWEDTEETDATDDDESTPDVVQTDKTSGRGGQRAAAKKKSRPVVNFPTPQQMASLEAYPRQIENWQLPGLSLLKGVEYGFTTQQEEVVREQARVLEKTLEEFRLEANVVEIDTGPVITMFELKLGAGIKVSQIANLSNDIARALKAHAIRVVAPISGKNTVGIEVPNVQKEKVRLKELMTLAGKKASEMGIPLFLGKDAGGAVLVADLTKMPHMLIAGTTGSGKSVCLNAVIVSMLMTQRPDHVKMILVDPKMVEMSQFREVPHLMCPIVTDLARAEKILEWAVTKMDERYELLAEADVKNISGYNALGPEEIYRRFNPATEPEKARISTRLPFIVVIIDELADLMMTAGKEVEHHLSRLAQKSRAVGIHIIVATQRPEAKVVTGLIKSNLPSRICFRVSSRMDSRIVLDRNGGEVLMGQGDMLFLPPGIHKLIRAQGTYLDDDEVHAILEDLASRAKPEFHPELVRMRSPTSEDLGLRDPLFDDAVRIILDSKRGSVSLLQRRLTVGYSRASRLIDQMADAGIVGDYKGSQAREVLLNHEQWEAILRQVEADEDQDEVPALSDSHDIRG